MAATLGSWDSSGQSGGHVMVSQASWGVGSLLKSAASSAVVWNIPGSLSVALNNEASRMLSPLRHMGGFHTPLEVPYHAV